MNKNILWLKDIAENCIDAVITYPENITKEDIQNAIYEAKIQDYYTWEDILDCLPDDCEIYDRWSYLDVIWY